MARRASGSTKAQPHAGSLQDHISSVTVGCMETPTIGRMVHYTLSEADVDRIIGAGLNSNNLRAGSEFSAVVLSLPAHHGDRQPANLTVFLDGPMTYWAIGKLQDAAATEARTPGTWHWPEPLPPPPE